MKFYDGEYSGLIEFRSAVLENPFGGTLLRLVETQYDDVDTAVADIAETLRNEGFDADEEAVLGLMTGEILPEEAVVALLSELATSEEDAELLYQAAIDSYTLAEEALAPDEDEDEDEEDEEGDDGDEDEEIDQDDIPTAPLNEEAQQYSRHAAETADAIQTRMDITDALSGLRDYADELLKDRHITPKVHQMLFSRRPKDDFMNFSTAVEKAEMTPYEYLRCMEFALDLFDEMGPISGSAYNFTSVVNQDVADGHIQFSGSTNADDVEEEAREMLNLLRGRTSTQE